MATKSHLLNSINTQLTAIITQAKHRLSMSALVDELYPSVISDTQATTNVLTASNATDRTYNLKIVKQGRCVTIKGRMKNVLTSIISNVPFATITNAEFLPSESTAYYGFGENGIVNFSLTNSGLLTVTSPMASESEVDINFTYFTLN